MLKKNTEQVQHQKVNRTIAVKPELGRLIDVVNLLPEWVNLPKMESKSDAYINWDSYNGRPKNFDRRYKKIDEKWVEKAVDDLSNLIILRSLAERDHEESIFQI